MLPRSNRRDLTAAVYQCQDPMIKLALLVDEILGKK